MKCFILPYRSQIFFYFFSVPLESFISKIAHVLFFKSVLPFRINLVRANQVSKKSPLRSCEWHMKSRLETPQFFFYQELYNLPDVQFTKKWQKKKHKIVLSPYRFGVILVLFLFMTFFLLIALKIALIRLLVIIIII